MAYIGPEPAESFTSFATQEFSTSATTSYTLDHAVANENEIALFVNNVRQQPGSGKAYTATGTALTLSAATASTDTMYCVFLGRALQTVTPATNSITAAMVGNDLISGKDALTDAPASTDELLISDAGTLKRIDVADLGNSPAFLVRNSSSQAISANTATKVTLDTEVYDTDSAFASNKFTVPSGKAGKYFLYAKVQQDCTDNTHCRLGIYKNGSEIARTFLGQAINDEFVSWNGAIELSASDYIEIYIYQNSSGGGQDRDVRTSGSLIYTYFGGYRLIGV